MNRYRIDISYDGTRYSGWQIQPGAPSIQGELEKALRRLSAQTPRVHGSGRTDRGVHARKQVAHFDTEKTFDAGRLVKGANAVLPHDIRVMKAAPVSSNFHARYSVRRKEYRYFISRARVISPFLSRYRTRATPDIDIEAMKKAASYLTGNHDFAAYTANANRDVKTTFCTLNELRVTARGNDVIITARAPGFLYKMVRSLAGILLRVGEGAATPSETGKILYSRKRTARVPTAPARGLFLWNVMYR
ncbi:MAG: tRNA pseudouridine(38-40) synthase TruA [Kiritimatiellia bacterium]